MKQSLIIFKSIKNKYEEVVLSKQLSDKINFLITKESLKTKLNIDLCKKYFKELKENNDYAMIMKHYIASILKKYDVTHEQIGEILNVHRTSISHLLNTSNVILHPDYKKVILTADKMIKENKYPYSKMTKTKDKESTYTIYYWE